VVKWLKDTAERVGATMAQVALGLIVPLAVANKGISAVPWQFVIDVTLLVGLICLLKCFVARNFGDKESASLVDLNGGK
jgi:hypothetical protein